MVLTVPGLILLSRLQITEKKEEERRRRKRRERGKINEKDGETVKQNPALKRKRKKKKRRREKRKKRKEKEEKGRKKERKKKKNERRRMKRKKERKKRTYLQRSTPDLNASPGLSKGVILSPLTSSTHRNTRPSCAESRLP